MPSATMTWFFSLGSVVLVSLASLAGLATLSLSDARLREFAVLLVSFAVGALLGDAFIHLIPEAFRGDSPLETSLSILGGMFVFFMVEKLLRHTHGPLHDQFHPEPHHHHADHKPVIAAINIFGDAIHNFIDGVLIGASYLVSPALGVSTTIAVLFHELPQELGDFGVLIHSGYPVRKAVWVNLATASAAVVGTIAVLLVGASAGPAITRMLIPITAGGFVYIAAADLIPELQHDHSVKGTLTQAVFIGLGVAVMALLTLVEH